MIALTRANVNRCVIAAVASAAIWSGCRARSSKQARIQEFEPLVANETAAARDIRLSHAGNIEYESYRDTFNWGRGGDDYHVRIEFPALTATEFQYLKNTYGFGLSQVQYKAHQTYELRDFLTPMMQAVLNNRFRTEITDQYVHVTSNCWSTAYEALRSARVDARSFSFFVEESALEVRKAFAMASLSPAPLLKVKNLSNISSFPDLRFGDAVLQFDAQGEVEHAALVIDRDLYFEKTAIITESPYRLVHQNDWAYPVAEGGYLELWRVDRGALKGPATLFQSAGLRQRENTLEKINLPLLETEISWNFDELGRARLEAKAFRPLVLKKPPGYL